jgi:ABC-type glycerol-3-phosphate transport system substrate-binding protein
MNLFKKILSLSLLMMLAIVLIGCNGDETTTTTESSTQSTVTTDDTTGTISTTEPSSTEDGSSTTATTTEQTGPDQAPKFVGLFPKQTYYKGSVEGDLLAGAKAVDPEDGELEITLLGVYSFSRVGSYSVYAYAEDSSGNIITEEITLTVKELSTFTIPDQLTTDPISITLWHSNGATIEAALMGYAEDFQDIYPNITVNIVTSGTNYDELRDNVVNAIKGGQLPNIVQNYPDHVMEYIDNKALISLTPFIHHPVHGYSTTVEEESFSDILISYRRENSQFTSDGEYYSVPFNKSTEVMIYNKTMFDMLIEDGVIEEVPNTWQGLMEVAPYLEGVKDEVIDDIFALLNQSSNQAIHRTPEQIAAIKDKFVPITYDSPANAFITLTRQWGGEYTTINSAREGVILFDNDEARDMLSYFYDNRSTNFTLPSLWGTEYASDAFKIGQAAVTFGSTGGARYNTPDTVVLEGVSYLPFEFGVAPMPYNADLPEERTAIQQGTNMSITKAGTDQEKLASWLFLKYLTSKEVQLDFALTTGYSPVRYSVYETNTFEQFTQGLSTTGTPLVGENLMISLAANAAAAQADILFYDQAFVGSSAARLAVEEAFERVIVGSLNETVDKQTVINGAIATAVEEAEKVL